MKEIIVYADWLELPATMKMGVLRTEQVPKAPAIPALAFQKGRSAVS